MAKQFRDGDWRSGYYRDMTFMFAIGQLTVQQWFAQLYAHADVNADPSSAGRSMNGHFATRSLDERGEWKDLMAQPNSSPDISPTGGQMPRLLGLAQASKVFRHHTALHGHTHLTDKGNEVAFGTIGDASTSEGHFWETMNAAGVLQVPLAMSVWDDGWGISVSKDHQTTKGSISTLLQGFRKEEGTNGIRIHTTKGWDYAHLNRTYEQAIARCREEHVPCLIHVEEVTQPQGHSTSGSHERYKSRELLEWYKEYDCNVKFREWILHFRPGGEPIATAAELDAIEAAARTEARNAQKAAWNAYQEEMRAERDAVLALLDAAEKSLVDGRCDTYYREHLSPELRRTLGARTVDTLISACNRSMGNRELLVAALRIVRRSAPTYEAAGNRAVYDVSAQGLPYDRFVLERIDGRWYIGE